MCGHSSPLEASIAKNCVCERALAEASRIRLGAEDSGEKLGEGSGEDCRNKKGEADFSASPFKSLR